VRLSLATALRSVVGAHRAINEDSAGASTDYAFVADGVGGHAGGDVASWAVSHVLMRALSHQDARDLDEAHLRGHLTVANAELAQQSCRDPRLVGLGTTFTGLFCGEGVMRVAHIGDSRAYRVRAGSGTLITRDDSYVQRLIDSGLLKPTKAWLHPQRNLILRSLTGALSDADHITVDEVDAAPGDRWLLCSDGLTDYVDERSVIRVLTENGDRGSAADQLISAALGADARDNITVAVCDVLADEPEGLRATYYVGAAEQTWPDVVLDDPDG
jgi:PPM family protein phosphatase